MKAFKKITALAVAMTMGCSVIAFAACNPENKDSDENDNINNITNSLPTGIPAQTVDATFASALKEEQNYISLNYTNKRSGTEVNHTKTNGVETDTDTTTYEINLTASGKIDLQNGDADLVAKSVAAYENDKGKDVSYRAESYNYTEYDFLRDWNMFSYTTDKEVNDFTGLELSYDGSAKINWEEILEQIGSIGGSGDASAYAEDASTPAFDLSMLPQMGDLAKLSLAGENVVLVNLAAAANTLKYENGVYSIDLIKTVDTVIEEVGSVVYALKGDNTVGDILNNDIIKKYFSVITELVPVETVKATVDAAIDGLSTVENEYVAAFLPYIQEDLNAFKTIEASTTYDYIVSLVSSQNLVNIVNTVVMIMQSQGGATPTASAPSDDAAPAGLFTKTLDKYTVSEILSFVNLMVPSTTPVTLKDIQDGYKDYVESVCDGEKLITGSNSAITELGVEYKVESGKLASQKVIFAYENKYSNDEYSITVDGETTSYSIDNDEKQEGTLEITYETSASVFKDVSGNTVTYSEYVWDEEETDIFSIWDNSAQDTTRVDFYVGAIVVDGEYAGFKLYDANNKLIGQNATSIAFQVGGTSYVIYEKDRESGSQESVYYYVERVDYGVIDYANLTQKEVNRTSTVAGIIEANA